MFYWLFVLFAGQLLVMLHCHSCFLQKMADGNLKKGESHQHVLAILFLDLLNRQNLLMHQNQFNSVLEAHAKTEITMT